VSGGQAGAENATLAIMIGGDTDDVETARPLFDVLGKTIVHVGPHGAAKTVKAAKPTRGRRHLCPGRRGRRAAGRVRLSNVGAGLEILAGGLAAKPQSWT